MCHRLLNTAGPPAAGGTPVTVLVRVDRDDFLTAARAGHGRSAGPAICAGAPDPADLAAVGELVRHRHAGSAVTGTAVTGHGVLLPLSRLMFRNVRNRTGHHRHQRCEAHHVIPWRIGGPTDLANLCLLCRFHHRDSKIAAGSSS